MNNYTQNQANLHIIKNQTKLSKNSKPKLQIIKN